MIGRRRAFVAFIVAAWFGAIAPADAQDKLGILFLHGKQGTPTQNQGMNIIAANLESAGDKVLMPLMPWGRGAWENTNVTIEDALGVIDGHIATLRQHGAGRIVLIGQSQGACVALAYAVDRGGLAGLVLISPGHNPGVRYRVSEDARRDTDHARQLVEQGRGEEIISGSDSNQGSNITMHVSARVYYSWMNPTGLAALTVQAHRLHRNIPIMVVVGQHDPFFSHAHEAVYQPAASHPYSKYVTNGADHFQAATASSKAVTDWVLGLPR